MSTLQSYCFDAAAVLGIGTPSTIPMPDAEPGEIILRVPGGLTLQALRDSPVGKALTDEQNWYEEYPWSKKAPPPGTYRLHVPVPGSDRLTAAEQVALLPEGETLAPVALVAAALLCIRSQGGADPMQDGWTRCAEQTAAGRRVALAWVGGRLYAFDAFSGVNRRGASLWASSVRTS